MYVLSPMVHDQVFVATTNSDQSFSVTITYHPYSDGTGELSNTLVTVCLSQPCCMHVSACDANTHTVIGNLSYCR